MCTAQLNISVRSGLKFHDVVQKKTHVFGVLTSSPTKIGPKNVFFMFLLRKLKKLIRTFCNALHEKNGVLFRKISFQKQKWSISDLIKQLFV